MKETVLWQAAWAPSPPPAQTRTRTTTTLMTGDHASRNWLTCTTPASYPVAIYSELHVHKFLPKPSWFNIPPSHTFGVGDIGTTDEDGCVCVWIIDRESAEAFQIGLWCVLLKRSTLSCERWTARAVFFLPQCRYGSASYFSRLTWQLVFHRNKRRQRSVHTNEIEVTEPSFL